jgi:hypothetical protein
MIYSQFLIIMMIALILFPVQALWTVPLKTYQESNLTTLNPASPYLAVLSSNSTGQNLSLQLDTTSSWVILKSSSLFTNSSDLNCSSTISSEWAGQEITGKICQILINSHEKTVKKVKFLLTESKIIPNDGVLGLAFSRLSDGHLPFVQQLEENVFSVYLSSKFPSVLTVGGYSDDYAVGDSVDLRSYPHFGSWKVAVEAIFFGNSEFSVFSYGIFNSSSVFITFSQNVFKEVIGELNKTLNCEVETLVFCDLNGVNTSNLPNLTWEISGKKFVLEFFDFAECSEGRCQVFFAEDDENRMILGIPFFKKFYLAFDMERFMVSLFKSSQNPSSNVFNTIYIVGVIVLAVIVSIPLCFMYMLSKIRGVTEQNAGYDKLN